MKEYWPHLLIGGAAVGASCVGYYFYIQFNQKKEIERYISELTVDTNDMLDEYSIIKIIELQQTMGGIPQMEREFMSRRQRIIDKHWDSMSIQFDNYASLINREYLDCVLYYNTKIEKQKDVN